MSKYMEKAQKLRNDPTVHYNCAQAVLVTFADVCGIDEQTAMKMGANFGSGMKMGAVCGTVTGAMMVLGLCGVEDSAGVQSVYRAVRNNHDGDLDCRDLLSKSAAKGIPRKAHCDGLVYELVGYTEEILREKGILKE